jgi:esterase
MAFVLAHEWVRPKASAVRHTAFVLHGVLGSGQNFRGLAKNLVQRCDDVALVLVDLRNHGASAGAIGPHTLKACAEDLVTLAAHCAATAPELPKVSALIGHSFGGKVAVRAAALPSFSELRQVFVLDSNLGVISPSDDYEVLRVIRAVRAVPTPIVSRSAVVQSLIAQGLSAALANWMTTNVRRVASGNGSESYEWTFDLSAIEESLADYFAQDLWGFLGQARTQPEFHLVVAENSDRVTPELRARAEALPPGSRCHSHLIENAGHWLHVDNPEAVLQVLTRGLA